MRRARALTVSRNAANAISPWPTSPARATIRCSISFGTSDSCRTRGAYLEIPNRAILAKIEKVGMTHQKSDGPRIFFAKSRSAPRGTPLIR